MKEQSILKRILFSCSTGASRLFRQNVGRGWIGRAKKYTKHCTVRINPGDVVIRQARPFHAGFIGMGDLIGWNSVTITPEMVGRLIAIYSSIEVKTKTGRLREDQINWMALVRNAGGIAGVARSPEEAKEMLEGVDINAHT